MPPTQLILVYLPGPTSPHTPSVLEATLNLAYEDQHRSRAQPCAHASSDDYRIVRHPHTPGLAFAGVPDCLLIYCNQRLVFANHILDGHGCQAHDLASQLRRSRRDAEQGLQLPADFQMRPGIRH